MEEERQKLESTRLKKKKVVEKQKKRLSGTEENCVKGLVEELLGLGGGGVSQQRPRGLHRQTARLHPDFHHTRAASTAKYTEDTTTPSVIALDYFAKFYQDTDWRYKASKFVVRCQLCGKLDCIFEIYNIMRLAAFAGEPRRARRCS